MVLKVEFQIAENLIDNLEEFLYLKNYDIKIYIRDHPIRMTIESKDLPIWGFAKNIAVYKHNSFVVKLCSLEDSMIEEEEYFGSIDTAVNRFNELKSEYQKMDK